MRIYSFSATERGIRERQAKKREEERLRDLAALKATFAVIVAEEKPEPQPEPQPKEVKPEEAKPEMKVHESTFNRIERRILKASGVTRMEVLAQCRNRRVALARMAIFYWAARLTPHSYPLLGRLMRRDHTTAIYSVQTYPDKRKAMGRNLRKVR